MVFGMISAAGTGPHLRLPRKINAIVYRDILREHAVPYLGTAINHPAAFMKDNAPCHTAKCIKTFFDEDATVMEWPAQSPDMNPFENIWKLLSERTKETSQNYGLIWKEQGRKYPLMNARH